MISTKDHLNNVRKYLGAHFKMVTDIVFTEANFAEDGDFYNNGQGWEPIGSDSGQPFFGSFDADGHTITGLYCNRDGDGTVYAGLFGYNKGVIRNLGMEGGSVTASSSNAYAGGIAGYNYSGGTISNCYNTGSVSSEDDAGGIAGYNYNDGTISNCYNTGSVSQKKIHIKHF